MGFICSYFPSCGFFLGVKLGWAAEKLVSLMTDLGTKWLMVKLTDKEALGKEQAEVLWHEFGFTHAMFCGSEIIGMHKGSCIFVSQKIMCIGDIDLGIY